MQRFAAEITGALDRMAAEGACPPARLLAPTGADASAFPHLAVERFGRLRGQAWEQAELPRRARGSVLVSLGNTAPLLACGRQAVVIHDAGVFDTPELLLRRVPGLVPRAAPRPAALRRAAAHRVGVLARPDRGAPRGSTRAGSAWCRRAASTSCACRPTRPCWRGTGWQPRRFALVVGTRAAHKGLDELAEMAALLAGAGHEAGGRGRRRSGRVPRRGRSDRRRRRRARPGDGRRAAGAVRGRALPRLPVALRGVRPAAAGGDGVRLPGARRRLRRGAGGLRRRGAVVRLRRQRRAATPGRGAGAAAARAGPGGGAAPPRPGARRPLLLARGGGAAAGAAARASAVAAP